MNDDDYRAIANCFNAIHVRLGQQMTANDVRDIFEIKDFIKTTQVRAESKFDNTIPNVILEASKGR